MLLKFVNHIGDSRDLQYGMMKSLRHAAQIVNHIGDSRDLQYVLVLNASRAKNGCIKSKEHKN